MYKGNFENGKFHGKEETQNKKSKIYRDFLNGKKWFGELYIDIKIHYKGERLKTMNFMEEEQYSLNN